ncbi:hypothetical protein [Nostoc sp.]
MTISHECAACRNQNERSQEQAKGLTNKKILNYFLWGGRHESQ